MYSFKQNISEEINRIFEKNIEWQAEKHDRKKVWKNQNLIQSLYNGENNLPSMDDIDQGCGNLKYREKNYIIGNCYILAALMGLSNQRPEFIKNTLIKEKNVNKVYVTLYGVKANKLEVDENGIIDTKKFEPDGKTYTYTVTKDEDTKWKTAHKAL